MYIRVWEFFTIVLSDEYACVMYLASNVQDWKIKGAKHCKEIPYTVFIVPAEDLPKTIFYSLGLLFSIYRIKQGDTFCHQYYKGSHWFYITFFHKTFFILCSCNQTWSKHWWVYESHSAIDVLLFLEKYKIRFFDNSVFVLLEHSCTELISSWA